MTVASGLTASVAVGLSAPRANWVHSLFTSRVYSFVGQHRILFHPAPICNQLEKDAHFLKATSTLVLCNPTCSPISSYRHR
jgi:hypothetical protein